MGVVIRKIAEGRFCRIYAYGLEERCDLFDFLSECRRDNPREFKKMRVLLERAAEHGLPQNDEKCKKLVNTNGIYEFKTKRLRILFFWDGGNLIVCSNGFLKKSMKTPTNQIDRAEKCRESYEAAKATETLQVEEASDGR